MAAGLQGLSQSSAYRNRKTPCAPSRTRCWQENPLAACRSPTAMGPSPAAAWADPKGISAGGRRSPVGGPAPTRQANTLKIRAAILQTVAKWRGGCRLGRSITGHTARGEWPSHRKRARQGTCTFGAPCHHRCATSPPSHRPWHRPGPRYGAPANCPQGCKPPDTVPRLRARRKHTNGYLTLLFKSVYT